MGILDPSPHVPDATDGARECRRVLNRAVKGAERCCKRIQAQIERYGVGPIQTALGDDAAELTTVYNSVKALAAAHGEDPGPIN